MINGTKNPPLLSCMLARSQQTVGDLLLTEMLF